MKYSTSIFFKTLINRGCRLKKLRFQHNTASNRRQSHATHNIHNMKSLLSFLSILFYITFGIPIKLLTISYGLFYTTTRNKNSTLDTIRHKRTLIKHKTTNKRTMSVQLTRRDNETVGLPRKKTLGELGIYSEPFMTTLKHEPKVKKYFNLFYIAI